MKRFILGLGFVFCSLFAFAQTPATPTSLQTLIIGKYRVSTAQEDNRTLLFEKAMDNDSYLNAAIVLNDAELEALGDTNDVQTGILNTHETRLDGHDSTTDSLRVSRDSTVAKQLGWYDVRDFGAVGDSTTDDTDAFKSAITYAIGWNYTEKTRINQ